MKCYNIEIVIKQLERAKKEGKKFVDEKELLNIATPTINNIDEIIKIVEKINSGKNKSFTAVEFAKKTNISRKTIGEWRKKGIIWSICIFTETLLEALYEIKERKKGKGYTKNNQ